MVESKITHEALRKIFDSFDKDNSGFIDVSEIKALSKELGHNIDDSEVQKIFAEIDTNKDGKISFGEFSVWWFSGKPTKLEGLVYKQLKAQKLLDKVNAKITRLGQTLESKYEDKVETHYVRIQAGEAEPRTKIHVKAAFGGPEEKTLFEETLGKLGRDWEEELIVLTFKSPNPESAKTALKDLIDSIIKSKVIEEEFEYDFEQIGDVLKILNFEYFTTADTVGVVISSEDPYTQTFVLNLITPVLLVVKKEGAGFVHADIGLKNDFASALKNAEEGIKKNILEEIIEGFNIDITAKIAPVILAYFRKEWIDEQMDENESTPGADTAIIPALIKGTKLVIKLTELKGEALTPLIQELPKDIPSLVDLFKPKKEEGDGDDSSPEDIFQDIKEGFGELKDELPQFEQGLEFLKEHVKASISLIVRVKKTIVNVHLHTSGVKEIFEAIMKK